MFLGLPNRKLYLNWLFSGCFLLLVKLPLKCDCLCLWCGQANNYFAWSKKNDCVSLIQQLLGTVEISTNWCTEQVLKEAVCFTFQTNWPEWPGVSGWGVPPEFTVDEGQWHYWHTGPDLHCEWRGLWSGTGFFVQSVKHLVKKPKERTKNWWSSIGMLSVQ